MTQELKEKNSYISGLDFDNHEYYNELINEVIDRVNDIRNAFRNRL
jgi:hypothetical protein